MLREYKFLIPLERNSDRKGHDPVAWEHLDKALQECFGGCTYLQSPVVGYWNGIKDQSRTYFVAIETKGQGPSKASQLIGILLEACDWFDQECIYLVSPQGCVKLIGLDRA